MRCACLQNHDERSVCRAKSGDSTKAKHGGLRAFALHARAQVVAALAAGVQGSGRQRQQASGLHPEDFDKMFETCNDAKGKNVKNGLQIYFNTLRTELAAAAKDHAAVRVATATYSAS